MSVIVEPGRTFLDNSGNVLNAGTVTFYVAGSVVTKKAIYPTAADQAAETNALSNPQTLSSAGRLPQQVHGGNSYRLIVKDSLGGAVLDEDNVVSTDYTALYPKEADETTAGVTVTNYNYPPGNVLRYGATEGGVTNCSTGFAAAASLITYGIDTIIPPGQWMLTSQVTWNLEGGSGLFNRPKISGYGAEIFTTGAISGIKVTGRSTPHGLTIEGVKINHRGNSTATAGFEATATDHLRLVDCTVEAHGVSATYRGIWLHNATAADNDTGCFWTEIQNYVCRKRSGSDSGNITHGIMLQGAANATNIIGGSFKTSTAGITITYESGQTYMANAVLIDGARFEGNTTNVAVIATTTVPCSGLRIVNTRHETATTGISLTGATTQPAVPLYKAGNYFISDVTTPLSNTNSLYVNDYDSSVTPDIAPSIVASSVVKIRTLTGTAHGLRVRPGGGSRGIQLTDASDTLVGQWINDGVSTDSTFQGIATGLTVSQLKALVFGTASTTSPSITFGTGTPEAAVTGVVGSLFLRTNGGANTTLYVKESGTGNTGWVAK